MITIRNISGDNVEIKQGDLTALSGLTRGVIFKPGDPGYDESRAVWNGMIDRRPGLIIRCIGAADVVTCVRFARERNLQICIRGGGHNIAGLAVSDDALMLDMRHAKGVHVDGEKRIAYCQAGCTLGDVDRDTQLHGLAAVLGFVSNTGITGLTLGGGFGYMTRRFGWTSDNVNSIELVTADGQLRRVSEQQSPDLFWALRGGGGNFGVVTEIEYELYPVGPEIIGGGIAWRFEDAPAVFELLREINATAPPEMACVGALRRAPPAPWLPPEVHGELIAAIFVCDTGNIEEAEKRAEQLKSFGKPVGDVIMRRPYVGQQSLLDPTQPDGRRYYWKSEYLPAQEEDMCATLIRHAEKIQSPHSAILLFPLHGALGDLPTEHSAVGNRGTHSVFNIAASWDEPADDERNIRWARDAWQELRRFSTGGTYVNFLTDEEGEDRIREAYGDNLDRLMELKRKYDPDNFFRTNKNIPV